MATQYKREAGSANDGKKQARCREANGPLISPMVRIARKFQSDGSRCQALA